MYLNAIYNLKLDTSKPFILVAIVIFHILQVQPAITVLLHPTTVSLNQSVVACPKFAPEEDSSRIAPNNEAQVQ